MGRRPKLKSDEFSKSTPIGKECRFFPKKGSFLPEDQCDVIRRHSTSFNIICNFFIHIHSGVAYTHHTDPPVIYEHIRRHSAHMSHKHIIVHHSLTVSYGRHLQHVSFITHTTSYTTYIIYSSYAYASYAIIMLHTLFIQHRRSASILETAPTRRGIFQLVCAVARWSPRGSRECDPRARGWVTVRPELVGLTVKA